MQGLSPISHRCGRNEEGGGANCVRALSSWRPVQAALFFDFGASSRSCSSWRLEEAEIWVEWVNSMSFSFMAAICKLRRSFFSSIFVSMSISNALAVPARELIEDVGARGPHQDGDDDPVYTHSE